MYRITAMICMRACVFIRISLGSVLDLCFARICVGSLFLLTYRVCLCRDVCFYRYTASICVATFLFILETQISVQGSLIFIRLPL